MASNTIVMALNLRTNKNALSQNYNKYFAEVHRLGTLSTYGLAEHMAHHNSMVSEEILRLVLGQLAKCMVELITQGIPVKLDGLGTFYPTVENKKGGAATIADAQTLGAKGMVKGVHIRFTPESTDLRSLSMKALKAKCSLRLTNVVESTAVTETVDGVEVVKRRNQTYTPIDDYAYQQENGSGGSDGDGDGEEEPEIRP